MSARAFGPFWILPWPLKSNEIKFNSLPFKSFETVLAAVVEHLPLFVIGQNFIGPVYFFVIFSRLLISRILVRVIKLAQLAVRLLDVRLGGLSWNLQQVVEVV
jgi:hypothetical protein